MEDHVVPIAVLATSTDVDRVLQVLETYPSALDQMRTSNPTETGKWVRKVTELLQSRSARSRENGAALAGLVPMYAPAILHHSPELLALWSGLLLGMVKSHGNSQPPVQVVRSLTAIYAYAASSADLRREAIGGSLSKWVVALLDVLDGGDAMPCELQTTIVGALNTLVTSYTTVLRPHSERMNTSLIRLCATTTDALLAASETSLVSILHCGSVKSLVAATLSSSSTGGGANSESDPKDVSGWVKLVASALSTGHSLLNTIFSSLEEDRSRSRKIKAEQVWQPMLEGLDLSVAKLALASRRFQSVVRILAHALLDGGAASFQPIPVDALFALITRVLSLTAQTEDANHADPIRAIEVRLALPQLHASVARLAESVVLCLGSHAVMAVDHVASTLQTLLSTSRGNCELRTIGYTIVQHLLENTGSGFVSCLSFNLLDLVLSDLASVSSTLLSSTDAYLATISTSSKRRQPTTAPTSSGETFASCPCPVLLARVVQVVETLVGVVPGAANEDRGRIDHLLVTTLMQEVTSPSPSRVLCLPKTSCRHGALPCSQITRSSLLDPLCRALGTSAAAAGSRKQSAVLSIASSVFSLGKQHPLSSVRAACRQASVSLVSVSHVSLPPLYEYGSVDFEVKPAVPAPAPTASPAPVAGGKRAHEVDAVVEASPKVKQARIVESQPKPAATAPLLFSEPRIVESQPKPAATAPLLFSEPRIVESQPKPAATAPAAVALQPVSVAARPAEKQQQPLKSVGGEDDEGDDEDDDDLGDAQIVDEDPDDS